MKSNLSELVEASRDINFDSRHVLAIPHVAILGNTLVKRQVDRTRPRTYVKYGCKEPYLKQDLVREPHRMAKVATHNRKRRIQP